MLRGGFIEEMTSELRPIGGEGVNAGLGRKSRLGRGHSTCARALGQDCPDMLEEQ